MKRLAPPAPVLAPGEVPTALRVNAAEAWGHHKRWQAAAKAFRRAHGVGWSVLPDRGHWSIDQLDAHGAGALVDARLARHGLTRADLPALAEQADAVAVPWPDGVGNLRPAHERGPGMPRPR